MAELQGETLTTGAIWMTLGGVLIKGIPALFKWLTGNMDSDKNDKFKVMQSWIDQLRVDVQETRVESKTAMQKVLECESRHDSTLKAMYEDRIKYEIQLTKLSTQLENQDRKLDELKSSQNKPRLDEPGPQN